MFLDKNYFYKISGLKNYFITDKNFFFIISLFSNDLTILNNLQYIYYLNIKKLKFNKFFFKGNYYICFKQNDFLYYLNYFIISISEIINDLYLNGIIYNNQYLNINNNNINDFFLKFLNINNYFLLFYYCFLNILLYIYIFLLKFFYLLKRLC